MSTLSIAKTGAALGAVVHGLEPSRVTDAQLAELQQAYAQAEVLFFADLQMEPQEQIDFASRFAQININRFFTPVAGFAEIAEVRKEPEQENNIGGGWHTDHSYDQVPAMGSMAYARALPTSGGDTLFASMTQAFAALSPGLQETLLGLKAVHSSRHTFGAAAPVPEDLRGRFGNAEQALQDAVHPVVVKHPLSGKPALYVNPGFTLHFEGWTALESAPLLQFLYQHAAKPEFTYRYCWQPNSMAFWDNRATWHYALNDYPGQHRLLHRITLEGVPLAAAAS